jgi:NAD(P)-dependent dehydrogenase (short-subunit alcohol dehydrogenase family)
MEMDTHYFGSLLVTRAFAPQLAQADRSAVLNILSVLAWISFPASGAYCAAKSAEWSMTNAIRQELARQGTKVSALHVGYMDTDMTAGITEPRLRRRHDRPDPKASPLAWPSASAAPSAVTPADWCTLRPAW